MVTNPVLQWAFTGAFLALAVHCVVGLLRAASERRGNGVRTALHHVLHLVMCLDMAAMAWPWWLQVPFAPQLVAFSLSAAWFAWPALREALRAGRILSVAADGQAGDRLIRPLTNATMMLAMVWMVAVMGEGASPAGGVAVGASDAMAGHQHGTLPPTQVAAGLALSVLMLAAALGYATRVVDRDEPVLRRRLTTAANTTMSAGMAAMCWLMVSA